MGLKTLEDMHHDWEMECVPIECPQQQHVEMKKAFMSGAAALLRAVKKVAEISEEEGVDYLGQLEDQVVQFFSEDIYKL